MGPSERDDLVVEGTLIGRHLLGAEPPEDLVERYCLANESLFGDSLGEQDRGLLEFVRGHPWSLSLLESAVALIRPGSLLRRKVVVMLAILETTPHFAADFAPRVASRWGTAVRLIGYGVSAATRAAAGLILYGVVVRWRR